MKYLWIVLIVVSLTFYFSLSLLILPEQYVLVSQPQSKPEMIIEISNSTINLGESFDISISAKNVGDMADILLVSVAFPNLVEINEIVKITSYDFTQSPEFIKIGDELGSEYLSTQKIIQAKYPSIEAYSRPAKDGSKYYLILEVIPKSPGEFEFFTKSVTLPHLTDESHYPKNGPLDHQGEFVKVFSVTVNP